MLKGTSVPGTVLVIVALSSPAVALDGRFPQMVDLPTACSLPKAEYSVGARVGPGGAFIGGLRVGITDYLAVGVSYGALNVIGSGDPDWQDRVEFDIKVRLADEDEGPLGLAVGYDSRGYGDQREGGGFEKSSPGLFAVASKTLPFSEHWSGHGGISRTLEQDRARPDLFVGVSGRFSQEFSVTVEYEFPLDSGDNDEDAGSGYLNAGLRWFFVDAVQIDFMFSNLVGREDSPELSSRAIAFTFYDRF